MKYIVKGSRATIIVIADSSLAAGAKAMGFNIGTLEDIREDKDRGKASRTESRRSRNQDGKRARTENVPQMPFVFPIELQPEGTPK